MHVEGDAGLNGSGGAETTETDVSGLFGSDTAAGGGGADTVEGGGGGEATDTGTDPDWYGELAGEGEGEETPNRDFAKAKGWKTPNDAVKSYREAERALRADGRVKIPGEKSSAEEVAAFRKAIGVPDDAKGYEFTPPNDADGKPVELDTALLDRIAATAHKMGVPKAALEAVVADYVQGQVEVLAEGESQLVAAAGEWAKKNGADKMAAVKGAVRHFGLTLSEQLGLRAAWGAERTLDIMAQIGEGLAEDTLLGGGARKFGFPSGAEAQARLDDRMKDPDWSTKAMVPGTSENAEYRRLNDAIGADADRKAAQLQ